jgi:5'(3')-deoxyribonucleotidase
MKNSILKKTIVSDIDGVIYDFYQSYIDKVNLQKGTRFLVDNWTKGDGREFFDSDKEWNDFWYNVFHDEVFYRNLRLYSSEIPKLITELRKKHRFEFATARSCSDIEPKCDIQRFTIETLLKDNVSFDGIYFLYDKNTALKNASYFVEDSFKNA